MQVAEVRRGFHDPFSVQHEHDPQYAVSARMLRTHVQQQFLFPSGAWRARFGSKGVLLLLGNLALNDFERSLVESWNEIELAAPAQPFRRKVFPQGVSLGIILRQQNTPEIGM